MMEEQVPQIPVGLGDTLSQKYRVERVLGAGGLGVVVAARHLQLDRLVAIKFLKREIASDPEVRARFSREALAAARLHSEHVTAVLDVGELEHHVPYLVMEYLEGCDLARLLLARGRLEVAEAVSYLLQAGEAVAEAHAIGIIHRDLKPANLFLTTSADGSPRIKVLDFGISKGATLGSEAALSLTQSAAVMGTPLYMSPEQMQSARGVDARADLWSLGAILHELVAGSPPFVAENLPQLCIAIMQQEPQPLHELRPEVPRELSAIVGRCLAKERSRRYGSMNELAQDLAKFCPVDAEQTLRRIAGLAKARPQPVRETVPLGVGARTPLQYPPGPLGPPLPKADEDHPGNGPSPAESGGAQVPHPPSSLLWRVSLGVGALVLVAGILVVVGMSRDATMATASERVLETTGSRTSTVVQERPTSPPRDPPRGDETRAEAGGADADHDTPADAVAASASPARRRDAALPLSPRRPLRTGNATEAIEPDRETPSAAVPPTSPPSPDTLLYDRE